MADSAGRTRRLRSASANKLAPDVTSATPPKKPAASKRPRAEINPPQERKKRRVSTPSKKSTPTLTDKEVEPEVAAVRANGKKQKTPALPFSHRKFDSNQVDLEVDLKNNGLATNTIAVSAADVVSIPRTITNLLHPHKLVLTYRPYERLEGDVDTSGYNCDRCGWSGTNYSYHCSECKFDLHPVKACPTTPATFNDPRHPHTLQMIKTSHPNRCEFCHENCSSWAWSCTGCGFYCHMNCAEGCDNVKINLFE
jgi:hypothetical protein